MASPVKLDLEKLRQSLAGRPRPSEAEGLSKRQQYGSSYKSPYSKRVDITKRPSAPSVIASPPPPPPTKPPMTSQYSQAEMNKNRKSLLTKPKKDLRFSQDSHAPTKLPKKTSEISGYFISGPSEEKSKKAEPYISPLMNAPSLLTEQYEEQMKARAAANTASPTERRPTPPPLIPPRPAKTDVLPQLSRASVLHHTDSEENDHFKKGYQARPRGSVTFKDVFQSAKGKGPRISLMLDPARRHTIRDGSIDLDLDKIAFAQVSSDDDENDEYEDDESDDFFNATQNKDDSLFSIRALPQSTDVDETFSTWSGHRTTFFHMFVFYLILSMLAGILTHVFVFYYNYGFVLPLAEARKNDTVETHLRQRYLINVHMFIMIVPTVNVYQFATLLFRLFPKISRTKMKWIHGVIHLFAAGCRILGAYYSIAYHAITSTDELYSMHGYIAVLAIGIHCVAVLSGLFFILPCCSWETRVTLIPMHRYDGNLIILADTAAILTGCLQVTQKYFASTTYPQFYPDPYHQLSPKSLIVNLLVIVVPLAAATSMYLQANYEFRRRKPPSSGAKLKLDLDLEAINRVTERRQHKALAKEAREHGKNDMEEVQIGSRKSFNLAGRQKYWHLVTASKGKSIPALINEAEKQKSNFTDADRKMVLTIFFQILNL